LEEIFEKKPLIIRHDF